MCKILFLAMRVFTGVWIHRKINNALLLSIKNKTKTSSRLVFKNSRLHEATRLKMHMGCYYLALNMLSMTRYVLITYGLLSFSQVLVGITWMHTL